MIFNFKKMGNLAWFEYKLSINDVTLYLLFTTKHGGKSNGIYSSLNMASHVGDNLEDVFTNRNIILQQYGLSNEQSITANQTHGKNIEYVKLQDRGKGYKFDPIDNTDGLITDDYNTVLMSFYADCVPLYFYDIKNGFIGLAHAGWKGTILNIAGGMVDKLCSKYVNPQNLLVVIGPSICKDCFIVDKNVFNEFKKTFSDEEFAEIHHKDTNTEKDKYKIDLWEANRQLLIRKSILPTNIHVMELCTYCNEELFYSYRRDNGQTGRMASIIFKKG